MPRRWLIVLIVLFWLTTSGVFFWREYWPYLEPGAPPPFAIELIDEARNPVPLRWRVFRNGEPALIATTSVTHDEKSDEFKLSAHFDPDKSRKPQQTQSFLIDSMESEYVVNPKGQLVSLKSMVSGSFQLSLDGKKMTKLWSGKAVLEGVVKNGQFAGGYEIILNQDDDIFHKDGKLPPVAVSSQGSVLMPLHPVSHVRGLRLGQSWHMPLVEPLGDGLKAALLPGRQPGTTTVFAKVMPQTQPLKVGDTKAYDCFVIDYTAEDLSARTWVRVADDQVMQQEANLSGDTWILRRE